VKRRSSWQKQILKSSGNKDPSRCSFCRRLFKESEVRSVISDYIFILSPWNTTTENKEAHINACATIGLRCTYLVRNPPAAQVSPAAIGTSLALKRAVFRAMRGKP